MSNRRRRDEEQIQAMVDDVEDLEPRLSRKVTKRRKGKRDVPKYHPRQDNKD